MNLCSPGRIRRLRGIEGICNVEHVVERRLA
jgi:hypothetical protein